MKESLTQPIHHIKRFHSKIFTPKIVYEDTYSPPPFFLPEALVLSALASWNPSICM